MILLLIVVPIFSTLNQIFVKYTASDIGEVSLGVDWFKMLISNPAVIGIIVCEIINFIAWMKILSKYNLSKAFPLSAISYVFILFSAWFIFHEPVVLLQWVGSVLIIIGVGMISLTPKSDTQA